MRLPTEAYIGIPYAARGRTREAGLDCWGLVCLVYREQFGIELPQGEPGYDPSDDAEVAGLFAGPARDDWAPVDAPQPGDVVLLRILGYERHVGVVCEAGAMLHAPEGRAVVIERLDGGAWRHRVAGFWRHQARAGQLPVPVGVQLSGRPHPLRTVALQGVALQGASLGEMIRAECLRAGVPAELARAQGHAWLDGEYIPAAAWDRYQPRAGQRVEYRLLPAGGDKNGWLRTILSIILIVVVYIYAPEFGPAVGNALGIGNAAGVALVGAVMFTAGNLLINAIAPVRYDEESKDTSTGERKNRLQGGGNRQEPYGAIPVVLGEHRFTPPYGAEPYVETQGGETYLRCVLVWGYGPVVVSDIRIGDTKIELFEEVQQVHLRGGGADTLAARNLFHSIYGRDVDQEVVNIKLETDVDVERTITSTVTELVLNFHFPYGLWKTPVEGPNSGDMDPVTVRAEIKIKPTSGGSWQEIGANAPQNTLELPASYAINSIDYTYGFPELETWWLEQHGTAKVNLREYTQRPLWQWTDIYLDAWNNLVQYHGMPTDSQYEDPSAALAQIYTDAGFGQTFDIGSWWGGGVSLVNYRRLPSVGVLGGGFVPLWRVCVFEDGVVAVEDLRDPAKVSGCGLTYSDTHTEVTIAAGTLVREDGATLLTTRTTKDAFDVVIRTGVPADSYDVRVTLKTDDSNEGVYGDSGNKSVIYRECYWTTLTGFANNRPIVPPKPLAMSAFRIKASNQLSGTLDGITGTVRSLCPDWAFAATRGILTVERTSNVVTIITTTPHGYVKSLVVDVSATTHTDVNGTGLTITSIVDPYTFKYTKAGADIATAFDTGGIVPPNGGVWTHRHTRSPASLFRYVLQHPASARPVANADIDLPALQRWHNICRLQGFHFDTVLVGGQRPLLDVLKDIAAAGRASPTLVDGKWSVVIDVPKPTVVQCFTPHNSWGFEGTRRLPQMPHALRVRFFNRARGWQPDERIVYDDGRDESNATLLERIDLPGITEAETVHSFGRFHLAQMKLRPDLYTINCDAEHLICTRGDRVKVAHDVPMWGLGSGRITAVTRDGSNLITGLTLDESLPMKASGESYVLRVRKSATGGNTSIALSNPVADGNYNTLVVATPFVDANIDDNDLVLFGLNGSESVDLLVQAIEPAANNTARLTLVDYAPGVFNADEEEIPAWDSQITLPPRLARPRIGTDKRPIVTRVSSDEAALVRTGGGYLQCGILVSYRAQSVLPEAVSHVEAQYAVYKTGSALQWRPHAPVPLAQRSIWIGPVKQGETYRLRLRYVDRQGITGKWTLDEDWPGDTPIVTVIGRANPPPAVAGLTLTYADGIGLMLDWTDCPDIDLRDYEIRRKDGAGLPASDWGTATLVKRVTTSQHRLGFPAPGPARTFFVKARDVMGNMSAIAATLTVDVDAPIVAMRAPNVVANHVNLRWITTPGTFPVVNHEIRRGGTSWATATVMGFSQTTHFGFFESAFGHYRYRVKAIDASGRTSAESTIMVQAGDPPDYVRRQQWEGTLQ